MNSKRVALWLPCGSSVDPHPKFGLGVGIDDATPPPGCEEVPDSDNQPLGEQGRPLMRV